MNFMARKYGKDIRAAALSRKDLDEFNAILIGELHGEDPRVVLIDIREERVIRALRRSQG